MTAQTVQDAANRMADDLTSVFNGAPRTWCGQNIRYTPTGITCSARIESPHLINDFYSSYSRHNTMCIWQCPRTCGIVTISEFDSLMCAGSFPTSAGGCCVTSGTDSFCGCGGVLGAALNNPSLKDQYISAVEKAAAATCTKRDDGIWRCGSADAASQESSYSLKGCGLDVSRSSAGTDGPWAGTTATAVCNPVPSDIDGITTTLPANPYTTGDTKVKKLAQDNQGGLWFGTNGWIDKKGDTDIIITCQDPGLNSKPIQAEIRMRVSFEHACEQTKRMRGIAPPACAVPGASGDPPGCPGGCPSSPCFKQSCKKQDNGKYKCVDAPDAEQPTTCTDPDQHPCNQGTCNKDTHRCEWDSPKPLSTGTCGDCGVCSNGDCVNREGSCTKTGGNYCMTYKCENKACVEDKPKEDTSGTRGCCTAGCKNGSPFSDPGTCSDASIRTACTGGGASGNEPVYQNFPRTCSSDSCQCTTDRTNEVCGGGIVGGGQ